MIYAKSKSSRRYIRGKRKIEGLNTPPIMLKIIDLNSFINKAVYKTKTIVTIFAAAKSYKSCAVTVYFRFAFSFLNIMSGFALTMLLLTRSTLDLYYYTIYI